MYILDIDEVSKLHRMHRILMLGRIRIHDICSWHISVLSTLHPLYIRNKDIKQYDDKQYSQRQQNLLNVSIAILHSIKRMKQTYDLNHDNYEVVTYIHTYVQGMLHLQNTCLCIIRNACTNEISVEFNGWNIVPRR